MMIYLFLIIYNDDLFIMDDSKELIWNDSRSFAVCAADWYMHAQGQGHVQVQVQQQQRRCHNCNRNHSKVQRVMVNFDRIW